MKIFLDKILPNQERDFDVYPLDDEQVLSISQSIEATGLWHMPPMRAYPGKPGYFEQACGHHTVEALRRLNRKSVTTDAVRKLTDKEMVDIMITENLTQRGYNAAAMMDSVQAEVRMIVRDNLSEIAEGSKKSGETLQDKLKNGKGIGVPAILERLRNQISRREVDEAVATMKATGAMNRIVAAEMKRAGIDPDADRKAKEAAAKTADEAKAKAEAATKAAVAEAEKKRKAQEAAEEKERKAQEAADKADAADKKKADAEQKKAAAELKEAEAERKKADAEEKKRKAEELKAERNAELAQEEAGKAEKAKKAMEADPTFDERCINEFANIHQAEAYRKAITSPLGLKYCPVNNQFPLIKQVLADCQKAQQANKKGSYTVSASLIGSVVGQMVNQMAIRDRQATTAEKRRLAEASDRVKLDQQIAQFKRSITAVHSTGTILAKLYEKWDYDNDPVTPTLLKREINDTIKVLTTLLKNAI